MREHVGYQEKNTVAVGIRRTIIVRDLLAALGLVTSYLQHDKDEHGSAHLSHQTPNITQPEDKMAPQ